MKWVMGGLTIYVDIIKTNIQKKKKQHSLYIFSISGIGINLLINGVF